LPHTDKLRIQLQTTRPSPSPITILKWGLRIKNALSRHRFEIKKDSEVGDWLKINSGKTGNMVDKVLRGSIMDSHCWAINMRGLNPSAGACLLKY
jgi:hypothetical protein